MSKASAVYIGVQRRRGQPAGRLLLLRAEAPRQARVGDADPVGRRARGHAPGGPGPAPLRRGAPKDWIELFIRNEKILSPDSEFHRIFTGVCNFSAI